MIMIAIVMVIATSVDDVAMMMIGTGCIVTLMDWSAAVYSRRGPDQLAAAAEREQSSSSEAPAAAPASPVPQASISCCYSPDLTTVSQASVIVMMVVLPCLWFE